MAIALSLSAGLQASEVKEDNAGIKSEQAPTQEEQNVSKLLYPYENPTLFGDLIYTSKSYRIVCNYVKEPQEPRTTTFKIMNLLTTDGCIDLSNKDIFEPLSDQFLITVDPKRFFQIDAESLEKIILIAPKALIEEQIDCMPSNFKQVMENWKDDKDDEQSVGMFFRDESWADLNMFDYLTNKSLEEISNKTLYENWLASSSFHRYRGMFEISMSSAGKRVSLNFLPTVR